GGGGSGGGAIGLNPFTSLRGQLTQNDPVELFRTTGLPRPTYLRALTLSDYEPNTGWAAATPRPGIPLAGPLTPDAPAGEPLQVTVENVGFRDYWLPLYGQPASVSGVDADRWAYDQSSGVAYSQRPREEETWQQAGVLPAPSAEQLRDAAGPSRVDPWVHARRVADLAAASRTSSSRSGRVPGASPGNPRKGARQPQSAGHGPGHHSSSTADGSSGGTTAGTQASTRSSAPALSHTGHRRVRGAARSRRS
ncbi:DUF3488 domain-containing protein, partial [Pseudonocardia pini]|uniref:DUF3488 domain-containing protein n=1 Tax=Pseudonocardia pini TaxID=2758030 RepID=UPI001C690B72